MCDPQMYKDCLKNRNLSKGKSPKKEVPLPEKEQRRRKLIKRSRALGHVKKKAAVPYCPTEEDVGQLLKEFTVDFLLNGT